MVPLYPKQNSTSGLRVTDSFTFTFDFSVGVYKNGRVEIIANDQGNRITPSYVAFTAEAERLIGDAAKNQLTSNPENTVFDAKRLIGRRWEEKTVQDDKKFFPFTMINKNGKPHVEVSDSCELVENKLFVRILPFSSTIWCISMSI